MAKNGARGGGRIGAIRGRSQSKNWVNGNYTKRNTKTGRFIGQKQDGKPFKGVRQEK